MTSCIKVGYNEENNYQRTDFDKKIANSTLENVILNEKYFALIEGRKSRRWTPERKRKGINPKKVGPFLFKILFMVIAHITYQMHNLAIFLYAYAMCLNSVVFSLISKYKHNYKEYYNKFIFVSLLSTLYKKGKLIIDRLSKKLEGYLGNVIPEAKDL